MDKPAILMICPQFHPLVGGYERAARRLCGALAAAGLRVVVVTERRDRGWPALEAMDGFTIRRVPSMYRRLLHTTTSLLSFAGFLLCHGREFDVWHVHQYGPIAAMAVALGIVLRRPVVLKLMNSGPGGIEPALGEGIVGRVMGALLRRVDACIAISEETHEDALRFGIAPERIHLVPNGVDAREFAPSTRDEKFAARRRLGLTCERLVICVGRLSAEKNQLGLLDVWAGLQRETRGGALLALIGEGPDLEKVLVRSRMADVAEHVQVVGLQSDMTSWYRAADILVIASHHEGLSNVMLEAMASGLPVISTRVSGSAVLIEPPAVGIVVDVGDLTALGSGMRMLLSDDAACRRLGMGARARFDSRFSLDAVAAKMIAVYRSL